MSKRTKTAQFRVTTEEDAHLRKAADDAGMKLSDYLRAVCLNRSVVVVSDQNVVVIPATTSTSEADQELMRRLEQKIAKGGQEEKPAPQGSPSPATAAPSAVKPATPAPTAAAAPASPPATPAPQSSPSEGDGMVGASASQAPPDVGAAAPKPAAGAIPGSGGTVIRTRQDEHAPGEFEPGGAEACPHCGGTDGQHHSFCQEIRGEPPVPPEDPTPDAPPPAPEPAAAPETREQFVERRVDEGEMRVVAEAEWRQREAGVIEAEPPPVTSTPAQQPAAAPAGDRRQPCPSCGTLKLPEAQCADCGRRPE